MLDLIPSDLGLDPEQFPEYRSNPTTGEPVQLQAIEFAMECDKRFCGMCVPTGVGKSLIAVSVTKIMGLRTVVLTGTVSLQDQYMTSFNRYGMVEIKGRSRYECGDYPDLDCFGGASMGCRYCGGKGCEYERARDVARNAQLVSTNYTYWMTINDKANGLERTDKDAEIYGENPIEMLVLDEGHSAHSWLESYLSARVYDGELKRWADPKTVGEDVKEWVGIAHQACLDLKQDVESLQVKLVAMGKRVRRSDVDELHKLERQLNKFERIFGIKDDWVIERRDGTRYGRMWAFDVVWPGRYAEKYLFCGVPKVIRDECDVATEDTRVIGDW